MKKYFLMMLLTGQLALITKSHAQNIAINSTGSLPDTSAMLDVSSTIKGFLAPRMTTTQQNAIPLPAKGLMLYNTTDNAFKVNIGTASSPSWTGIAGGITSNALSLSNSTLTSTVNGFASSGLALPFVTSLGLTSSDITVGGTSPVTSSGTYTLTLPTVNSNVGTFTNATITVNAKGLVTAASSGSNAGSGGLTTGGWALTGNSGTTANNFFGTNDGQPLVFKVNGTQAAYLGLSGSSYATSFGVGSSASYKSTAIGSGATANTNNEAVALGYNSIAAGYRSIAIGSDAQATSTNDAIAIGTAASAGSYQGIAIGAGAATSSNNSAIAVGVGANASAYQSTAVGSGAVASAQNATAIGNGASASNANYISIGNTTVSAIRGQVNFTTYSDGRFKRNIQADVPGLDFILQLRPVTYNWDIHKFNQHSLGDDVKALPVNYNEQTREEEAAIIKKESITYTGFIAQEVEKAAQQCRFNFSGVLKPLNDKDAYSLSYAEFVVPLVKATQELNKMNETLNDKINSQQKLIEQLIEDVNELKKKIINRLPGQQIAASIRAVFCLAN